MPVKKRISKKVLSERKTYLSERGERSKDRKARAKEREVAGEKSSSEVCCTLFVLFRDTD